jgi:mono/diheme cytochrome c family protein
MRAERNRTGASLAAALALVLALAAAACGAQRRGEPSAPAVQPRTAVEQRGERLFHRFCYQCHPGGEAGLGPAINDKPLPALAIKTQIRRGVGAMPAFGPDMLTDPQVDAITEYVRLLRASPVAAAPATPPR